MRKRQHRISFYLNDRELSDFENIYKKSGVKRESYLRSRVKGLQPKDRPPPDYFAMQRELHAIGNNIRQIAARANATGFFMKDEYDRYYKEFKEAMMRFQDAVTRPEKR